jgi:hypothetical protein
MKLKIFFANFQILGPLGCQGWVVIPQNVKKVKITAPYWAGWVYTRKWWSLRLQLEAEIFLAFLPRLGLEPASTTTEALAEGI